IESYAFDACLSSVSLPASLETLSPQAFVCDLSKIDLSPANPFFRLIDGVLFSADGQTLVLYPQGRTDKKYVVPDGVVEIGPRAFNSVKSLQTIELPDGIVKIGDEAFEYCESLSSIRLPSTLSSVGKTAFGGCRITSFDLPDGLEEIGDDAFRSCPITSLELPDNLKRIGDETFYSCNMLTRLRLPSKLREIGSEAFAFAKSLTSITLPPTVEILSPEAFDGWRAAPQIEVSQENPFFRSVDGVLFSADGRRLVRYPQGRSDEKYVVPDGVVEIGPRAFFECKTLKEVVFSQGLATIGAEAFKNNKALQNVAFSEGLTTVGAEAFLFCKSLQQLDFPSTIETIGAKAFFGCDSLHTLVFNAASPREIGESAFAHCKTLTAVEFPPGLQTLGESAFSCAESLGKISLPEGLEHIGEFAFFNCLPLVEIAIPEGVKTLSYAPNSCESLTKVLLPNSLTTIGDATFAHCKSLAEIAIPDDVEEIAYAAFADCPVLVSITLPPRANDDRQRGVSRLRVPKDRLFPDFKEPEKNRPERVQRLFARLNPLRAGRFRRGKIRREKRNPFRSALTTSRRFASFSSIENAQGEICAAASCVCAKGRYNIRDAFSDASRRSPKQTQTLILNNLNTTRNDFARLRFAPFAQFADRFRMEAEQNRRRYYP
ncbi:MAG: leucine-rich repeat domain-containing protein, partial [Thermoguttaceae bacterium]|nr:leucine-rich repeat domain-containing protein [Thermoguttaceae bacterium]